MPPNYPAVSGDATSPAERIAWKLYFAGFMGGLILAIVDLSSNDNAAIALKFQAVLVKLELFGLAQNGGAIGVVLVAALGALFCWVWPVRSRGDAFIRGFSVFAILSVGTPFKLTKEGEKLERPGEPAKHESRISLIPEARAQSTTPIETPPAESPDEPSATVTINHYGISSCKPHYWGIFGLGSFFNNTLEVCKTGHILLKGAKVQILECWDTGLRDYRYARISYVWKDKRNIGWAMTGQGPAYWTNIVPDAASTALLPDSCKVVKK